MTWKRYQNELIALIAFVFMLGAYGYKTAQVSSQAQSLASARHAIAEVQEVISLKKIWDDARTGKKVERLQTLVPSSKVTWSSQKKKVTASYKTLTAAELNTLVTKILNVPVEIQSLKIRKVASSYDVEFKCKW
ncbi:hypothetical protein MN086_00140 [Sulfurovum sp. XGS-02]|uniref:hypothetical protein n=1 Tax=Sulfurovum sp. XGS-02 TaxID=2925411 RepID=UPI002057ED86|nr:hypothetical protein [Sulfurovum sp. XGS-02]UPT77581.1 hypothetical protein MN086_00140 [Sulfurovum sp. XGS-02]